MIEFNFRCLPGIGEQCPLKQGRICEKLYCAIEDDAVCLPSSVSGHERRLRALACVLTNHTSGLSLHHCRGASMSQTPFGSPGAGQKQNPALQVRLSMQYHVGIQGIDGALGAKKWESKYRTQVALLNSTSRQLKYSVWMLALRWASPLVRGRVERFCQESPSLFLPVSMTTGETGFSSARSESNGLLLDTLRTRARRTSNASES